MAANPFAAAVAKASTPTSTSKKKKENVVEVDDKDIAKSIHDFVVADAAIKELKSDQEVAKGVVVPHCIDEWVARYAEDGRMPETIKFRVPRGLLPEDPKAKNIDDTVTFIVQDRGEQYNVSDEQLATITALVGQDNAEKIILRDMTFSFDTDTLNKKGVMEKVGAKLAELVADGTLTDSEFAGLIKADPRTTVRKGSLNDLARYCLGADGKPDAEAIKSVLEALGSHTPKYIKA